MAKTFNDVITLMRRIVGENDGNDPDSTQDVLLDYVANFYKLIMGQEIKSFDLYTWFEFPTVVDEDTYQFKDVIQDDHGITNITPPIYAIDSNNGNTEVNYFQDPEQFYRRHPISNEQEDAGRPWDLLFFDNELLIRPKADQVYTIRIRAYKELFIPTSGGNLDATANIDQDYFLRYIAYGASLDYLADFGNIEDYSKFEPIFKRYRNLVMMRKAKQATTQRTKQAI